MVFIAIVRVARGGAYRGGGRRRAGPERWRGIGAAAGGVGNVHHLVISATTNLPDMCARPGCQIKYCFLIFF